ncbi:hypothetical protein [Amycolatopsis jejuensis]|uniref:hypothetical protein n=1 Tax=Amycolatopsis jejuensis TaxID=330084 RepID=UPI00052557BE|nr:hypothetical protein [Amycolatopsis jejuensis]
MRRWGEALVVAAALGLLATPAEAEPLGGLVITPGEGQDAATIRMHTSGGCPADADAFFATMRGKGMPADGQIVVANTDVGLSHTAGFDVYLAQTLRDFAADNKTTLSGQYDIAVYCIDSFSQQKKGEFTAALKFDTPVRYAALGAAKGPSRAPETPPPGAGAGPVPGTGATQLPGTTQLPVATSPAPESGAPASPETAVASGKATSGTGVLAVVFGFAGAVGLIAAVVALIAWMRRRVQE